MSNGSGLFTKQQALIPHLLQAGGLAAEVANVRKDLVDEFAPVAAIAVEEFTNPVGQAAGATNSLHAATATVAAPVTILKAALVALGLAQLVLWPRQLTFTTAGSDPTHGPPSVVITGKDAVGTSQTETLTLSQSATTDTSAKYWSDITSVVFAAAPDVDATIAVGYAAAVLHKATATVAAPVTLAASDLVQPANLASYPRQLVFTTGSGGTPSDAPASATIIGTDARGKTISETLALAQTGTTATSLNCFAHVTSIVYPAADGTGATIEISFGTHLGLHRKALARAGWTHFTAEYMDGTVPTPGTMVAAATDLPYGSYVPNTAVNGVHDYCIYYEYDASA